VSAAVAVSDDLESQRECEGGGGKSQYGRLPSMMLAEYGACRVWRLPKMRVGARENA
jgi:hypothetical protein